MNYITVKQFYNDNKKKLDLKIITGEEFLSKKKIIIPEINRPGLALAGFFDYFPYERIQIFGKTEFTYLKKIGKEKTQKVLNKLFSYNICCVLISRNLKPPYNFELIAQKNKIPVIMSSIFTTKLISSVMLYLERKLAPKITLHGTFIDVYGIGVLLVGKSGIGKSEITLELIKRGHRLISDDIIEIRKMSDDVLEGRGLNIIQHHMEIRGLGIIDVKNLFGVGAVRESQKVELLIHLEEWEKRKNYERLGMEEQYEEMLGVKVPKIILPVKPGRNLSVIIEVAAMTQRLKSHGYNPAKELNKTILKWMKEDKSDAMVE
ncbi:MAG: HPr(Ser) kinase/phosphatase [Candidatus Goldbacteria bacterium]|nr:HPr(Ser) kinase/phosphatase [Candidatus Goldiibacteriota bacterium]